MAAIVLWVVAWETMAGLDLLNLLRLLKVLEVAHLAELMTLLAVETLTKDKINNTLMPTKVASQVPGMI